MAQRVVNALEASGFSVWWDQRIGAGEIWRREITDQLERAKCVVVLWTCKSAAPSGRFVQEEAARAQRLGKYLPIKTEECDLPLGFSEMQALSLVGWSGSFDDPVIAKLSDLAKGMAASPTASGGKVSRRGSPAALRSERRSVTVVRAQLIHPSARLEDPEYLDEFTDQLGTMLHQLVDHRTSLCHEIDASGFTCIFGVPAADELDEVRAVEKALHLEKVLREELGVASYYGVAAGTAVTTPRAPGKPPRVSSNLRTKAEELLPDAAAGQVLIPAEMTRSLGPYFEIEPAGTNRYLVKGRTAARDRWSAAEADSISRLSGRTAELGTLKTAIASASQGSGQALSVVGDAGAGKSRLILEAVSLASECEFRVLQTTCTAFGRAKPLGPLVDLLRQLFTPNAREQDGPLIDRYPVLKPYEAVLQRLVSPSEGLEPLPYELDGQSMNRAWREASIAAFTVAADNQPLAIVIDDFQLADETTQEIIGPLAEAIAHSRALLLIGVRPSGAPNWPPLVHCHQLVLPPLDVAATAELLLNVTGARSLSPGLAKIVRNLTDGVPLFVEELARALIERDQLQIVEGQLTSRAGLDQAALPRSLEALIRARLDRLEPDLRTLLQTASAIGRQFEWGLLRDLIEADESPADLLGPALALGLVEQVRLLPEPIYRFRQNMTQLVAHESLLKRERRELHQRIGEQIEAAAGERADDRLEELAYHFANAELASKAVHYLLAAAKKALDWGSARVAADLASRALTFVEDASGEERDYDRLLLAYATLGNALTLSRGYFDRELGVVVEKARALGPDIGSEHVRLATTWWLWRHYYNCLMLDEAAECARRLHALADSMHSTGVCIAALGADGIIAYFRGDLRGADRLLSQAVALWAPAAMTNTDSGIGVASSVMSYVFLGFVRVMQAQVSQGWAAFDAAYRIASAARQPDLELFCLSYRQMALFMLHRFEDAVTLNSDALKLAATHDRHSWEAVNRILLGRLRLERGDLEGAAQILREMESSVSMGAGTRSIYHVLSLQCALARNDAAAIATAADMLAAGMEKTGARLFVVDLVLARTTIGWAADRGRVLAEAQAVMAKLAATGGRVAHLRMAHELASLLLRDGEIDQATSILQSAIASLDDSELSGCPLFERARDALRQTGVTSGETVVQQVPLRQGVA